MTMFRATDPVPYLPGRLTHFTIRVSSIALSAPFSVAVAAFRCAVPFFTALPQTLCIVIVHDEHTTCRLRRQLFTATVRAAPALVGRPYL